MNSNIRILTWFNFFTDFKVYGPIAILYFSQISGNYALGMTVFSVITVSTALFEVPTGIFSDMIGRRNTIILGAVSSVIFTSLYALAPNFWILALAGLIEGLATSFYSGNNNAFLYDTLLEEKQEHRFAEFLGKTSTMFQVALAISSLTAILFLFNNQFRLVFWISVIPQLICLVLAFFLKEPSVHSKRSGNVYEHLKEAVLGFIHNRKLRMLSLTSIIGYGVGEATFKFNIAFINTVWPTWAIPIARTASYVGAALSFHFAGRTLKKFNTIKMLLVGNFYTRAAYILAVIFPSTASPILMSSTSVFYGTLHVGRGALMQKEFKQEQRATMGSLDSFVGNLLFGVVAILLGILADKFSPAIALLSAQFIQVFNSYVYWKLLKEDV